MMEVLNIFQTQNSPGSPGKKGDVYGCVILHFDTVILTPQLGI